MFLLRESTQKWARWLGYVVLALVTFVFVLHYSFPYERLEDEVIAGLEEHFDVVSLEIGPGFFPGDVVITDVELRTRLINGQGKPTKLIIDEIVIDPALLSLIGGTIDLDIEARMGDGKASAHYVQDDKQMLIDARTTALPLVAIPGVKSVTGGAAVEGGLTAKVKLRLPLSKLKRAVWTQADGTFELACVDCALPKGTKLRPVAPGQSNAFSQEGFTLPAKVRLGEFGGSLEIVEGKGKFVDFGGKSPDGELLLEGGIEFRQPVGLSEVTAYLRIKFADALKRREAKMLDIENLALGPARRPDGYFGVSMRGPLSAMKYRGSPRSPIVSSRPPPRGNPIARPPVPRVSMPMVPRTTPPPVVVPPPEGAPGPETAGPAGLFKKTGTMGPDIARKLGGGAGRDDVGGVAEVPKQPPADPVDEEDEAEENEEVDDDHPRKDDHEDNRDEVFD